MSEEKVEVKKVEEEKEEKTEKVEEEKAEEEKVSLEELVKKMPELESSVKRLLKSLEESISKPSSLDTILSDFTNLLVSIMPRVIEFMVLAIAAIIRAVLFALIRLSVFMPL